MERLQRYAILAVDSSDELVAAIRQTSDSEDYDIIAARSIDQALAILTYLPIHFIVTRTRLRGDSGLHLLQHLKYIYRNTVRITVGGSEDQRAVLEAVADGTVHYALSGSADGTGLAIVLKQAELHYHLIQQLQALSGEVSLNGRIMNLIGELEPEILERIAPRVMDLLEN